MARTLVGTRIRERRRNLKVTQSALARSAGISASYLNLIEHNRRGIAGKTLLSIASELGMDPGELTEGADGALINQLTEYGKADMPEPPELDRVEEFVGRYPGWARFLAATADRSRQQTETLLAMTDRMNQDPFLSETMHQILSNITAIRSTAGILDTTPDISDEHRQRFLGNLRRESQRLSTSVETMVEFFDAPEPDMAAQKPASSISQEFWDSHRHFLPDLETGATTVEEIYQKVGSLSATAANSLLRSLKRYDAARVVMPLESFKEAVEHLQFDPLAIARRFDTTPGLVLFRLAHMPEGDGFPMFGMMECDMSGAVLHRKEIPDFTLPQYSSACPLWPVYRAFGNPAQTVRATLEMPSGARLTTFSVAESEASDRYDLPPMLRSTMIFSNDQRVAQALKDPQAPVLAGLHCSVCPRKECAERRVDYILG